MRGNSSTRDLAPLDLEIEATFRRNNAERKRKALQDKTVNPSAERTLSSESSSSFPTDLRESEVGASEAHIMADEQPQRVTLKDYSSSTVP